MVSSVKIRYFKKKKKKKKREGNRAELTFAKTSGSVSRDREKLANSRPVRPQ